MKAKFFSGSFLLYSGDLMTYIYNDKDKVKKFKLLRSNSWGADILVASKIISAANISPVGAKPVIEYEALP